MEIKSMSERHLRYLVKCGPKLTNSEQEFLVQMHCDSDMRDMFKQCHRTKFWAKAFKE